MPIFSLGTLEEPSMLDAFNKAQNIYGTYQDQKMKQQYMQQYPHILENQVGMSDDALTNSRLDTQNKPTALQMQNALNQAKLEEMQINNQYLPDTLSNANNYKAAMAKYMSNPSMAEKYMTSLGKSYVEPGIVNKTLSQPQLPQALPPGAAPSIVQGVNNGPSGGGMFNAPPNIMQKAMQVAQMMRQQQGQPGAQGQMPPQMPQGMPGGPGQMPQGGGIFQPPQNGGMQQPSMQSQTQPQAMPPGAANLPQQNPLTVDPDELKNAYEAMRQKQTSDVSTRNKAKFAVNIQKTFDEIDPSIISRYSGLLGLERLKVDKANAVLGNNSDPYTKYNNFVRVQVPILADQIRQFYGTSIQPSMLEQLHQLANPITWDSNPSLALSQFKALKGLLGKELDTYLDTLNAPIKSFKGGGADGRSSLSGSSTVSVISPDGTRGTMPSANLDAALKAGYKRAD